VGPLISCDFVLDADDKRQNVRADEIRARFHELISLPAWERRAKVDEILDKERTR